LDENTILINHGQNNALSAWDISDPKEIKCISSLSGMSPQMKLYGDTLYCWDLYDGKELTRIDVSSPQNMKIISTLHLDGISSFAQDACGRQFVASEAGVVEIDAIGNFTVIDPIANDKHFGRRPTDDVAVCGDLLIAGGWSAGLHIFRLNGDGSISLLKRIVSAGRYTPTPFHFTPDGSFIIMNDDSVISVDIRNPEKAKRLKSVKWGVNSSSPNFVWDGQDIWLFGETDSRKLVFCSVGMDQEGVLTLKEKINLTGFDPKSISSEACRGIIRQGDYLLLFTFTRQLGVFEIN
jgi:hypothetical protein